MSSVTGTPLAFSVAGSVPSLGGRSLVSALHTGSIVGGGGGGGSGGGGGVGGSSGRGGEEEDDDEDDDDEDDGGTVLPDGTAGSVTRRRLA